MVQANSPATLKVIDEGPETPWGLLTTTWDGTIIGTNARFATWTGRSYDALCCGLRWKQLLAPASRILYETHFIPRLEAQNAVSEVSLDLARADGSRFPILASALRRIDPASGDATVSITVFDATETRRFEKVLRTARRDAEAATEALAVSHRLLRVEHERLTVMLRSIADAVITIDAGGRITSFNPTAEEITGLAAAGAIGAPIDSVGVLLEATSRRPVDLDSLHGRWPKRESSDFLLVRAGGSERRLESTEAPLRSEGGQVEGWVYVWRDVTQKRIDDAERQFEATHDRLTRLLNRQEFERLISLELAAAKEVPAPPSLLLHIGLDQFKIVNDTAGATAGDDLLVAVGTLLRQSLRQTDVLARLGGDEFGVLLLRCPVAAGKAVAATIRQDIENFRFHHAEVFHTLTVSIGLAVLPKTGGSANDALASASMACQTAKEAGRNRVYAVDAEDADIRQRREQMSWVSRIRRDLDEARFELFFQPIVRVDGSREASCHGELLLRLRDEENQLVPPGAFINAAERYH
ncbi:MAG: bifunctional diguanylate cyclase/phosphodiesterase, partial [Alphaproteobacteria bacterium]